MPEKPELYFPKSDEWYDWLLNNHESSNGVFLIFYKLETNIPTMRWEDAVKVALCFGWIDSTVKSLGNGKRRQYFCQRKSKSVWSALNKKYIVQLTQDEIMHTSGLLKIEAAKKDGSWTTLDNVENLVIPNDLQAQFNTNKMAFINYQNFSPSYKKGYLYWLNQAKREATRQKRIDEIIELCKANVKSR